MYSHLSVDEVIRHYGENYVATKYAFDLCLEDLDDEMGGAPWYESPEGDHSFIEYRSLGVSISFDHERVESIDYRYGPVGTEKSQCTGFNQVVAFSMVAQLSSHQLCSLEKTGKLTEPKDLGFPRGHINSYYTFEMQIKGKDFKIWVTPR